MARCYTSIWDGIIIGTHVCASELIEHSSYSPHNKTSTIWIRSCSISVFACDNRWTSNTTSFLSMRCEELSVMFLVQVVQTTENPKIKTSGEMNPIFERNWGGLYYSYYLYILFPSGQYTLQAWTKLPQIWVRSNTQLATLAKYARLSKYVGLAKNIWMAKYARLVKYVRLAKNTRMAKYAKPKS